VSVSQVSIADQEKLDPDPDPDPHQSGKLDPDSHRSEKQDPETHQSEKLEALEAHFGALEPGGSNSGKKLVV
jgi:hypothetical protein